MYYILTLHYTTVNMAKSITVTTGSLKEKYFMRREKLKQDLLDSLRLDMLKLMEENVSELSDCKLVDSDNMAIGLHRCIIHARFPHLSPIVTGTLTFKADNYSLDEITHFLRCLYSEDNLSQFGHFLDAFFNRDSPNSNVTRFAISSVNSNPLCANSPEIDITSCRSITNNESNIDCSTSSTDIVYKSISCVTDMEDSCCSRLGSDLLRLYLSSSYSDISLKVGNINLPAHRCILSARSSYFKSLLSGSWKETNNSVIELHGVEADAVEYALRFIYGACLFDISMLNVSDVLLVADMYQLTTLTESISAVLEMDKCHLFHKPCSDCISGTVAVLPVACLFRLTRLWERAVKWILRHLSRVCNSKHFATLPLSVINECVQSMRSLITTDNVLELIIDCDCLLGGLAVVRHCKPVIEMASVLMDSCIQHLQQNFLGVLNSSKFASLSSSNAMGLGQLTDILARGLESVPVDSACHILTAVVKLHQDALSSEDYTDDYRELVSRLELACERFMKLNVTHLVNTATWNTALSPELQKRITDGAWYVVIDKREVVSRPQNLVVDGKPKKIPTAQTQASKQVQGTSTTVYRSSRLSQTNVVLKDASRCKSKTGARPKTQSFESLALSSNLSLSHSKSATGQTAVSVCRLPSTGRASSGIPLRRNTSVTKSVTDVDATTDRRRANSAYSDLSLVDRFSDLRTTSPASSLKMLACLPENEVINFVECGFVRKMNWNFIIPDAEQPNTSS